MIAVYWLFSYSYNLFQKQYYKQMFYYIYSYILVFIYSIFYILVLYLLQITYNSDTTYLEVYYKYLSILVFSVVYEVLFEYPYYEFPSSLLILFAILIPYTGS